METQSILNGQNVGGAGGAGNATNALGAGDFLNLLVAQLSNQDPFEPTSNQELLDQISSIREIELSTNLSNSLQSLTEQQNFASSASLIGKFATGSTVGPDGKDVPASGMVVAVRFDGAGKAVLELEDGGNIPLERVTAITSGQRAAEVLMGQLVTGIVRSGLGDPRSVEGVVTATREEDGRVMLELDNGETLGLTEVIDAEPVLALGDT